MQIRLTPVAGGAGPASVVRFNIVPDGGIFS